MQKAIWFDMDGTIADLYGVQGWLDDLQHESTRPYSEAKPLLNMSQLARVLHKAQAKGYTVNVISWTSKAGSPEYNRQVAIVKRQWLKKHLPSVTFENIDIVKYGTPKHNNRYGILFDDEIQNREGWGKGAYNVNQIITIIKGLK